MEDTKKREAWLQELKMLRKELLEKKEENQNTSSSSNLLGKTYQKSVSSIASKMYERDKESAKVQVLMLALLTFLFETVFLVGSYLIFHK